MPNRQRDLGINIRVTPAEKKKIERNARKCKLTVSEYLRQLAMNKEPKELPSEEIIAELNRLRDVSAYLSAASDTMDEAVLREKTASAAKFLNTLHFTLLQLMLHAKAEDSSGTEVNANGND